MLGIRRARTTRRACRGAGRGASLEYALMAAAGHRLEDADRVLRQAHLTGKAGYTLMYLWTKNLVCTVPGQV